jgi:asparagine synthase (glutamine-hydrolysing)
MCGLVGICYDDRRTTPDPTLLPRMVAALRHRGPDGEGYFTDLGVGLGHARLSIIDITGGAQPIHSEDKSVWIVYNGEVFNYPELRRELMLRGHRFYTATDTEVLVHLYQEHGTRFVERLNGQFAFAIWDRVRHRLMLARDHAGILPLYWSRFGGSSTSGPGIVFASEAKALFASGMVRADADPDGIEELWTFWAPLAPRTAFRGVNQLRPGEVLVFDGGKTSCRRYWQWSFPADGEHRRTPVGELKHELLDLLGDATRLRLRADVPVGAYLSGGLDSSSLVALLSREIASSLHSFSLGFDASHLDESSHQRIVATHLNTQHHHLQCSTEDIAESFGVAIRHAECPVLRSALAPMRLLSGSVRAAGMKVVLTGEGADEVLGGYDVFKEAKVRQFWSRYPASRIRPLLLGRLYPYLKLARAHGDAYLREFFGQGIAESGDPLFSHRPRWSLTAQCKMFWSRDFSERVTINAQRQLESTLPADFGRWHPFNRAEYLESTTLLSGYLLSTQGDRMLMSNSVEGRFPYLDPRLLSFARMLHPNIKMRVLREKYLLRQAMESLIPASIVARQKQPYRAPDAATFLADSAPEYVNELTSPEALKRYGYFDAPKVTRLIASLRRSENQGTRNNMSFMGILSTQLWHREFIER